MKPDSSSNKLIGIDFVRAIAILAVIIIHVTADLTARAGESPLALAEGSKTQIFAVVINKLSNFAVPVFITLSGLVLFYRYKNDWSPGKASIFYRKRVLSALIPYVVWAVFYYVYNQVLFWGGISFDWGQFSDDLLWGNTSYHLYFMIIILQFYVLFPLFMSLAVRFAWFAKSLILIGLVIQGTFYVINFWYFPFEHKPALSWSYFLYFLFGGYVGLKFDEMQALLQRKKVQIGIVTILSGAALLALFLGNRYWHISFANHWFEIAIAAYSISIFLFLLTIEPVVRSRASALSQKLASIGTYSFGIYLVHPALLSLYAISIKPAGTMSSYQFYVFLSLLWTLLGSYALIVVYKACSKSIANSLASSASNRQSRRGLGR